MAYRGPGSRESGLVDPLAGEIPNPGPSLVIICATLKPNNPPMILEDILSGEYMQKAMLNNRPFVCHDQMVESASQNLFFGNQGQGDVQSDNISKNFFSIDIKNIPQRGDQW